MLIMDLIKKINTDETIPFISGFITEEQFIIEKGSVLRPNRFEDIYSLLWSKILNVGINRNIIISDCYCETPKLSNRLINLMKVVYRKNINNLNTLFVEPDDEYYKPVKRFGVKIIPTDFMIDLNMEYENLSAVYPKNKSKLCVGIGEYGYLGLLKNNENINSFVDKAIIIAPESKSILLGTY